MTRQKMNFAMVFALGLGAWFLLMKNRKKQNAIALQNFAP